jgi:hypothetical protein
VLTTLCGTDTQKKADKTLSGASGGFGFFGGREQKYQDAADLYTQAANAFRLQKAGALSYVHYGTREQGEQLT